VNVEILGVSFDSVEANRAFAEKYKFNYPLLCDVDKSIGVAYGAAEDTSAESAKRIAYLIGTDGRIEKAYGKVSAGKFPDDSLQSCAG
jgi:peroxiredoxin Q/BCP